MNSVFGSHQKQDLTVEIGGAGTEINVAFRGTSDLDNTQFLDALLFRLHSHALSSNVRKVLVDFRGLEFMNSSGFKSLVTWVRSAKDLEVGKQYRICFLPDAAAGSWQR